MPHSHDHHSTVVPAGNPRTGQSARLGGHPSWCSPHHCCVDDDGVRIHEQEPVRWEDSEIRFESRLFFPDGELPPTMYLQLSIDNLRLTWRYVDAYLPIEAVRRLRDQLTAHLDAADSCPSGARLEKRVRTSNVGTSADVLTTAGSGLLG